MHHRHTHTHTDRPCAFTVYFMTRKRVERAVRAPFQQYHTSLWLIGIGIHFVMLSNVEQTRARAILQNNDYIMRQLVAVALCHHYHITFHWVRHPLRPYSIHSRAYILKYIHLHHHHRHQVIVRQIIRRIFEIKVTSRVPSHQRLKH